MNGKAKIIDGKALSVELREKIRLQCTEFEKKNARKVGLAVILAGEDEASAVYVKNKIKACEESNIKSFAYYLPKTVSQNQIIELIDALNNDENVDGILVQLPLPKHLDEKLTLGNVTYKKDVDGFHCMNAGNLFLENECLAACTPSGIIELIKSTGEEIYGKNAVVIGRSNIVGKPVAMLLLQENATVTICHSKTADLKSITKTADILVVAIGKKEFVTGDMVKSGAIVIDVGMNRFEGKLYGDCNFEQIQLIASYITPVPGGVGPMTITSLMKNTLKAALEAHSGRA
ncbi:c-1-tetrahydrofolate synthase cytoplasmic-related [Holotrichia oblita]|nr:c-1-tetrahydrofolate synthase cytoplasmic-related [Holotrichia oblita]